MVGNEGQSLHHRVAEKIGWAPEEACSLSLETLREIVRPFSKKLDYMITVEIAHGHRIRELKAIAERPSQRHLDS